METQTTQFITPIKPWNTVQELSKAQPDRENEEVSLFENIFRNAVSQVYETQADVEEKQYLLSTGQIDDAHTLPIAEAKASLSVDILITLRNKAMEAYSELMKMSV